MKLPSLLFPALLLSILAPALAAERRGDLPDTAALSPEEQLQRFKVPPGFEVQLVAAEPDIQKPININFDAAGRLWVTGSEMYPWPAATDALGNPLPGFAKVYEDIANAFGSRGKAPEPQLTGRDTIRILSALDTTGRARKVEIFADKLNIPTGIQPLPRKQGARGDTAIVYSIPNIWRFEDTDGDGKADKREPLYEGFGYLDTHGMSSNYIYWIDGWIYGCHGFRNRSEVKDRNGNVTVFESGNTYRFKPDGSKIEYFTHGQTNPFGLTFDPYGNLFSADSHSKPIYMLIQGGYYEGIGKQHDGLGFAPRITDDDHGSSAIAGIMYYADNEWPAEYHGNLFNGNPGTNRINRAKLDWHGSTPKATRLEDFVVCDDPCFRPVQVKLGPDGAMYIADFYNPIIGHYEVPLNDPRRDRTRGRIWRVVWKGENGDLPPAELPDMSNENVAELVARFNELNLETRRLATNEIVDRIGRSRFETWEKSSTDEKWGPPEMLLPPGPPEATVPPTIPGLEIGGRPTVYTPRPSPTQEASLVWVMRRLDRLSDGEFATAFEATASRGTPSLHDQGNVIRIDALRVAIEHLGSESIQEALPYRSAVQGSMQEFIFPSLLAGRLDPLTVRLAVTAMPRFLAPRSTVFRTSIDEFDATVAIAHEPRNDAALRYAATIAIREVLSKPGRLQYLSEKLGRRYNYMIDPRDFDTQIADVALAVPTPDAAQLLVKFLKHSGIRTKRLGEYLRHAVLHLPEDRFSEIVSWLLTLGDEPLPLRLIVADAISDAARKRNLGLPAAANAWTQGTIKEALQNNNATLLDKVIAAVRDANIEEKAEPLRKVIFSAQMSGPRRVAALEALMNLPVGIDTAVAALADITSPMLRKRAVELLVQRVDSKDSKSGETARAALLAALPNVPDELAATIAAGLMKSDTAAEQLIALIETGKVSPALIRSKAVAGPLNSRSEGLKDRAAKLTADLPPEDTRLDAVIAKSVEQYRAGQPDSARGQQLFQQQCAACHKLRNTGGNVGPNLDGVAARGLHRLIEDILDPNRNVDPAFRQTLLETKDGRTVAGVHFRTDGNAVLVKDASGQEHRVRNDEIRSRHQSHLSLMPATFEQTLPGKDLLDLLAYLLEPAQR